MSSPDFREIHQELRDFSLGQSIRMIDRLADSLMCFRSDHYGETQTKLSDHKKVMCSLSANLVLCVSYVRFGELIHCNITISPI